MPWRGLRAPRELEPASLDAAFVVRAIPLGSARHLSYLFAPPQVRAPLLGIYALLAEWLALLDPATERTVAQIKLSWWHEEMSRLTRDAAVHPVSRYLARQPGADPAHFSILIQAVEAAMVELGGAPLTLAQPLAGQPLAGQPLASQSTALLAGPLRVASRLACQQPDGPEPVGPEPVGPALAGAALDRGTQSLAMAQYLSRALSEYARGAGGLRAPVAMDELRHRADTCYADVARDMPAASRADLRHLLVLAALGRKRLNTPRGSSAFTALEDMLLAWTTARRAAH